MKTLPIAVVMLASLLCAGCAHPIKIAPDATRLETVLAASKIPTKVGYFVPATIVGTEITTPGGGGDNVRYFPYRDADMGYQRVLSNVFASVTKLESADVSQGPTADISYIVTPEILTSSGGSGLFTWPPTSFTVDLTTTIRDRNGQAVASKRVVGVGSAETGERIREHGIAGKRAMEDALIKMQSALLDPSFAKQLGGTGALPASVPPPESQAERLRRLDELRSKGLITPDEYAAKRSEIVKSL